MPLIPAGDDKNEARRLQRLANQGTESVIQQSTSFAVGKNARTRGAFQPLGRYEFERKRFCALKAIEFARTIQRRETNLRFILKDSITSCTKQSRESLRIAQELRRCIHCPGMDRQLRPLPRGSATSGLRP